MRYTEYLLFALVKDIRYRLSSQRTRVININILFILSYFKIV